MRHNYRTSLAVLAIAIIGGTWFCCQLPAIEETNPRLDALMTRKLTSAQKVLEGLAKEDYELLRKESQRLHLLSLEASWQVLQTEDYRRLSEDFRKAAEQIERAAKENNIDKASMSYIKLTIACLECHHHVRQVRAGGESPALQKLER